MSIHLNDMKRICLVFSMCVRFVFNCIVIVLPWALRRWLLVKVYHYEIASKSHIGFAYIYPKHLIMKDGAAIKHFNVAINLDEVILEKNALIDRSNWITGFPTNTNSKFFEEEENRRSALILGENSVITKKHHFDCTNVIQIGKYVTIAGYNSQFLTHSVNVYTNRQASKSIQIGDYCFISTRVVILGGTYLPSKSILAAGAVLNKGFEYDNPNGLYAGIPATRKKKIESDAKYFIRTERDVF